MARGSPWRGFARTFLRSAVLIGGATLVLGKLPAAARCQIAEAAGSFIAECRGIGDYEHAAYAFGLERDAVAALGAADLVIVGNSRAQVAFSTKAARQGFAGRGTRAYLAGFGYGEGSAFALDVLGRAGARPRALIVNADPFFADGSSLPASRIRERAFSTLVGALRIKIATDIQAALCRLNGPRALCGGRRFALHRAASDGSWTWRGSLPSRDGGTDVDSGVGRSLAPPGPAEIARARAFIAAAGVAPGCAILTAVPNAWDRAEVFAAALSRELGTRTVLPSLTGLRTADGSHLDPDSAERWSAAFLAQARPMLDACLSGRPAAP